VYANESDKSRFSEANFVEYSTFGAPNRQGPSHDVAPHSVKSRSFATVWSYVLPNDADSAATAHAPAPPAGLKFVLVCVFIDMLGIGLIIPVLPMLIGEFAGGKQYQAQWYGALITLFGLMQFIFMPILGALSDRLGRRPVLLFSIIGVGINFLITALAPNLWFMALARVIGGMSSASISVASAYAADVSTPANRAKSFGMVGAAFGLGFIFGPVLGGLLGHVGLRLPFFVGAALCGANAIYGYTMVPESLPMDRRMPFSIRRANPFASLARLALRTDIRGLVAVFALVTFGQIMLQTTWVLYTYFRFGWDTFDNGMALFCVGISAAVVQAGLLGWLIRRLGEVRLAMWGLASGAIVYVLYGLATQGWMMYVFILCNLLAFAAGPALQGIVSKLTDPREQGSLMGSLQSVSSLAMVVVPGIGALLLARVSALPANDWRIGVTFFVSAILQTLAFIIAWRYFANHPAVPAETQAVTKA
jgi:MFS transporter, DHA1 family, tetracycline resistance protein